jgi:hypothetical protein
MAQLDDIIEKLVKSTEDNSITWVKKASSTTTKRHSFQLDTSDVDTRFEFDVELTDDLKPKDAFLWLYNKDIVDGRKIITEYKYPGVSKLKNMIYDKYIKDGLKQFLDEDTLFESILNKIGDKQHNRDYKISKLLNEPETVIEPVEEEVKEVKKKNWFGF